MASYPGTISTFTSHVDIVETIAAAHPNLIQTELVAVETTLGTNPQISTTPNPNGTFNPITATYSNLAGRLANIETGLVVDTHTQYLHLKGGDTITVSTSATIGLAVKAAASQSADLFQVFDSTSAKKVWIDSSFRETIAGGLTVQANGATITGTVAVTGPVTAQKVAVTTPNAGAVGMTVNLVSGQTGDAIQVINSLGAVIYKVTANGNVTASPLTQSFFISGAFTTGLRAARWIAPFACTLTLGNARLDGGTAGGSVKWTFYVNGSPATTGGAGNLSSSVAYNAGTVLYDFLDIPLNAGDSVQLYVSTTGTTADFSVTMGGVWIAA